MLRRKTNSAITNYIRKDFMYTKYLYKYYINTLSIHIHIYTNITTLLLVSIKNGLSENKVERPFLYFSFCHDSIWLVMRKKNCPKAYGGGSTSTLNHGKRNFPFPFQPCFIPLFHGTVWVLLVLVYLCLCALV